MWKYPLLAIGLWYLGIAIYMWFAPQQWYHLTPGVSMTSAYNLHFIRDIALIFAISGAALIIGAARGNQTAAIFGAAWPAMHAIFHIWIWVARGVPFDQVALINMIGIQLPAWLAVVATLYHFGKGDPS